MDKIEVKTVKARAAPIWRCGMQFAAEPQVLPLARFEAGELKRLAADPALIGSDPEAGETVFENGNMSAAFDALLEDHEPGDAGSEAELAARIDAAIRALPAEAYTKSGKPDVTALRKVLPDDEDAITGDLRDAVWKSLTDAGFVPPKAEAKPST